MRRDLPPPQKAEPHQVGISQQTHHCNGALRSRSARAFGRPLDERLPSETAIMRKLIKRFNTWRSE